LLDEIAAKTDGSLFAEEMTKAVGVLREDADAYHLAGSPSALAIPASAPLMARFDRVEEVAQTASVIGRGFGDRSAVLSSGGRTHRGDAAAGRSRIGISPRRVA
jgi:hypothetical protein